MSPIRENPRTRRRPRVEVYEDAAGEWRWRLKAKNHRIIAVSGEGYKQRWSVVDAWYRVSEMSLMFIDIEFV